MNSNKYTASEALRNNFGYPDWRNGEIMDTNIFSDQDS